MRTPALREASATRLPPTGILRHLPAIAALRGYNRNTLFADVFAGLTVAAVAVPQAMAYAIVAGLPPQYGLYTAIVTTAIGAIFDSSKQLINGPTNAISIAVFSAIAGVPEPERVTVAIALALVVGLIQLGITLLRLGDLTRYISQSVIVGFTLGAAALLLLGQLRHVVGLPEGGTPDQSFLVRLFHTYASSAPLNHWALLLAAGTVVLVLGLQQLNRLLARVSRVRIPEFLLAIVGAGALVAWFDLDVAVIGALPKELPGFQVPELRWPTLQLVASDAVALALLGLLEAVAMAKAIAARTRQRLDIHQQCLSEALANIGGSFFQCYPGSGSLSRSALNHQAGAMTQWSGVVSAIAVATTVLLFAPLAAYVPRAALAGILIISAFKLVNRHELIYFVRTSRFDAIIVAVTAISAFAISVELCLLIGVLMSFMLFVPRAGSIQLTPLVIANDHVIREKLDGDSECSVLGVYNFEGEMFFGALPDLEKHLDAIEQRVSLRVLVLRIRDLRNPDAVCIEVFDQFIRRMRSEGVTVIVCGVAPEMAQYFERSGITERLGAENLFLQRKVPYSGIIEAVERAYSLIDISERCSTCPVRAGGQWRYEA